MNVLSLFSGIGAFEKALTNLNIPFYLVNYCEIDRYASKSYCAVHDVSEDKNLWDVTKVTKDMINEKVDIITHGSPCQSFSIAGKQEGGDEGSGTRSSLMYETIRIVSEVKPKFIIWENVKNVLSKKHIHNFENYKNRLNEMGYNSYYKVLNAKDYGIPQNRERIFCISIHKDIDKGFEFPKPFELKLKLKDIFDENVDDKYFLSSKVQSRYTPIGNEEGSIMGTTKPDFRTIGQRDLVYNPDKIVGALTATDYKQPKQVGIIKVDIPQIVLVRKYPVDCDSLCKCLRKHKAIHKLSNKEISNQLGVPITKVEHWFRNDKCFAIPDTENWLKLKKILDIETDEFDESIMTFETKTGVYEQSERHYSENGLSPTITSTNTGVDKYITGLKIRKLTPNECWKLQGFTSEDCEKAKSVGISDTQLYKQAGNSICVAVLENIYKSLGEIYEEFKSSP